MADNDAALAQITLLEQKVAFERLKDALRNIKDEAKAINSTKILEQVETAEVALNDLKIAHNRKAAPVPFIAGSSVKSSSGMID